MKLDTACKCIEMMNVIEEMNIELLALVSNCTKQRLLKKKKASLRDDGSM